MSEAGEISELLGKVNAGEPGATDALAEAIHDDLRAMARKHLVRDLGRDMAGATIQPTILANDTLLKLIRQRQKYDNAGHLFAIASRLMMRLLIDYHRERKAAKRGGGAVRVSLEPGWWVEWWRRPCLGDRSLPGRGIGRFLRLRRGVSRRVGGLGGAVLRRDRGDGREREGRRYCPGPKPCHVRTPLFRF
jgi:hypothetical protein